MQRPRYLYRYPPKHDTAFQTLLRSRQSDSDRKNYMLLPPHSFALVTTRRAVIHFLDACLLIEARRPCSLCFFERAIDRRGKVPRPPQTYPAKHSSQMRGKTSRRLMAPTTTFLKCSPRMGGQACTNPKCRSVADRCSIVDSRNTRAIAPCPTHHVRDMFGENITGCIAGMVVYRRSSVP